MNIAALVFNTIVMIVSIVALVRQRANTKRMDRIAQAQERELYALEGKVKP